MQKAAAPASRQSAPRAAGAARVAQSLAPAIHAGLESPATTLDDTARRFFEPRFGFDLSKIRIHHSPAAAESAEALGANAFTVRDHIVFNQGRYDPNSSRGRRLLAHELTHVAQNRSKPNSLAPQRDTKSDVKAKSGPKTKKFWVKTQVPLTSEALLHEFVKQYFKFSTEEQVAKQLPRWHFIGQAMYVTEADAKRGGIWIPVQDPNLADFDARSPEEQKAINSETDQRFWNETGYKPNTPLGKSAEDQQMAGQWMAVRSEVQLEHTELQQIQNLPPAVKAILFAGDSKSPQISREDYPKVLALAARLQQLTPEQLNDYKETVTGDTTSFDVMNRSLDMYLAKQQGREDMHAATDAAAAPLIGAGDLYDLYLKYKDAKSEAGIHPNFATGMPLPPTGGQLRDADKAEAALLAALIPRDFPTIAAFEAAIEAFRVQFRTEALDLALAVIDRYDHMLFMAEKKFSDKQNTDALTSQIAASGASADYSAASDKRSTALVIQMGSDPMDRKGPHIGPTPSEIASQTRREAAALTAQADSKVDSASGKDPFITARGTDREKLATSDAAGVQTYLLAEVKDRKQKAADSRAEFTGNPDHIFELDDLVEVTRSSMKLDPKGIYNRIVNDFVAKQKLGKLLSTATQVLIAVALAMLVPGGGWLAAAAMLGNAALSSYQAYEAYKEYKRDSAEYDIGFIQEEPSLVWVGVSIAAAALDLGMPVAQVLKGSAKGLSVIKGPLEEFARDAAKLGKAGEAVAEGGDAASILARLSKQIDEAEGLEQAVKNAIKSHAAAEIGFKKAAGNIMGRMFSGVDPYEGSKLIYYAIKREVNTITKLSADAEWLSLVGDITKMPNADKKALTESFEQVKKFMNASKNMDEESRLKFLYRLSQERAGGEGAFENLMTDVKAWKPKTEYQVAAEHGLDEAYKDVRTFKDERDAAKAELRAGPKTPDGKPDQARINELRKDLSQLEDQTDRLGNVQREGLITKAGRKVSEAEKIAERAAVDPKTMMRQAFGSSEERLQALAKLDEPPVTGLKIKTRGGIHPDHIVSLQRITKMDGFGKLRPSERNMLAVWRDNLVAMDTSANLSKGERSWGAWKQASFYYDEATIQTMLTRENAMADTLQKWILTTTKGR